MYKKIENVDSFKGDELVKTVCEICRDIHLHTHYYLSPQEKVIEELTKMCIEIHNLIYHHNIKVVYLNDSDVEEQFKNLCETFGYFEVCTYGFDTLYDYYYFTIENKFTSAMYSDINELADYYLNIYDNDFLNECKEETEKIREIIKNRWDKIDFNYDEYKR